MPATFATLPDDLGIELPDDGVDDGPDAFVDTAARDRQPRPRRGTRHGDRASRDATLRGGDRTVRVILDSIGWPSRNAILESFPHDLAPSTIAGTVDDGVAIAARLAKDAQWCAVVRARMAPGKRRVYRDTMCTAALEDFLDRVGRGLPAA